MNKLNRALLIGTFVTALFMGSAPAQGQYYFGYRPYYRYGYRPYTYRYDYRYGPSGRWSYSYRFRPYGGYYGYRRGYYNPPFYRSYRFRRPFYNSQFYRYYYPRYW
jgi:hypothetical protein